MKIVLNKENLEDDVERKFVKQMWHTFFQDSGVTDFTQTFSVDSNLKKEEIAIILKLYSLDGFIFERLSNCSNEEEASLYIETLGPFSTALTMVIDCAESNCF